MRRSIRVGTRSVARHTDMASWSPVGRLISIGIVVLLLAVSIGCGRGDEASDGNGSGANERQRTTGESSTSVDTTDAPTTSINGDDEDTTNELGSGAPTSSMPPDQSDQHAQPDPSTAAQPGSSAARVPVDAPSSGSAAGSVAGKLVVIDPGHNGNNWKHTSEINRQVDAGGFTKACNTTGTASGDLTETAFNLAVAQRLSALLSARGIKVVLTRSDNDGWGPCIDERGQIAARAGADLLVSIHADGSSAGNHGFHVISPTSIKGYTESIAAPSSVAAATIRDALVSNGFQPSTYIGKQGLIQRGDLGTLNRAEVPAIMIEAGNMKNSADLALLGSADGQQRLAAAIADGVQRFFQQR